MLSSFMLALKNGSLSGSTVLLTMTVDVPLFGCPEKIAETMP